MVGPSARPAGAGRIADKSIEATAPYTDDANGNNTLLVEWGLNGVNFSLGSSARPHSASPYTYTIPNLTNGTSYQVRVTYEDANGVTGTAVQTFTNLIPANPLQHNSSTTGSTKWGGWGLPGMKYGEFVCETCHTNSRTNTNIKNIKTTIVSPNAPTDTFPGSAVVFTDTREGFSNFGDDLPPTGHTSSNKVCEVCHTARDT